MSANTRLSEQDRQILQLSKLSHEAHELIAKGARSSYSISLLMMALQLFKDNKLCSTSLTATQDKRTPEERRRIFKNDLMMLGANLCFDQLLNKLSYRVRNRLKFMRERPDALGNFLRMNESEFRKIRGIGDLAILEINATLYSYGLTLGMSEQEVYQIFNICQIDRPDPFA